ncbi:uncharacterized protein BJ212DRAFT_1337362 [Suillus subaureus]|uniref:Nucleoporin Nup54 alpha-helical domain-containing protein n=1 Tax=Suillus subaureus TaxID=48587 RepID=A0A9P7EHV9_9AGAM|nr:uncharacterized protein BJ212DRAFT_1337362 [Suillus subaureus]KAG1821093.1 hypothetical protein BJ212DRAFT_1337362 [Suillus subaureus]
MFSNLRLKSSSTNIFGTSNTGTSIFGQSNASKPTTSLFGNTQPSSGTGTTTTGFGGFGMQPQIQTQQPAQGSSVFGGGTFGQTQQQQPSGSTSIFGQPAQQQQQQQQQPTTSLFGQPAQQQPLGTSLFVNPSTTNTTGGAFGSIQPQQSTSLFGTTQPQQQTSNMFGNTQPQQPGGLFGSTTTQQAAPAGGLGVSTAGTSIFGQQRQSSMMSTTPISGPAPFSKSTKFNDLPDDIKKTFEAIDSHIQGRIQISNELKQRKMGEEAIKGQELIRELHKELLGVSSVIQSDSLFAKDLKSKTEQAVQDTIVATNIIEGFKNPHQSAAYLKNHASFPLEFFTRVTQEMQERLQWFKNTIEQIERKLSASASQSQNTPQAISSTLQTQHAIFVSLAARTAAVDAEVQKVKTLYTQLWRAKTGSMRDPFNELDHGSGGEFGMESLQVK